MIRRLAVPLLMLLLLVFSVAAVNAFIPRRQCIMRPSIDSNQSLHHRRDVSLPFGLLQLRGGNADDEIITSQVENDEDTIDETTDSETSKKAWEEEIKRTQSFYKAQSVNASEGDGVGNGTEDVRGYGSSQSSVAESNPNVVITEGDESDPAQAAEDIVDVVKVKADTEDNNTAELLENVESGEKIGSESFEEETVEEELEEEQHVEEVASETFEDDDLEQVESVASEEEQHVEEVESETFEEEKEEVEVGEEIQEGVEFRSVEEDDLEEVEVGEEIQEEVVKAPASKATDGFEEDAGNEGVIDLSVNSLSDAEKDDDGITKGDADTADKSTEYTQEHDPYSSIATLENDEPSSLLRKSSALLQVMLLRGQAAVSQNKGVQYLAQNKPKMKVIALASLGGMLSMLVGGHFFLLAEELRMQETEILDLPNDWIEEESYVDETDEDD